MQQRAEIEEAKLNIPSDPFLGTTEYIKFLRYKMMRDSIRDWLRKGEPAELHRSFTDEFISMNPFFFEGYMLAGELAAMDGDNPAATRYYRQALGCEIPTAAVRSEIIGKMSKSVISTKQTETK